MEDALNQTVGGTSSKRHQAQEMRGDCLPRVSDTSLFCASCGGHNVEHWPTELQDISLVLCIFRWSQSQQDHSSRATLSFIIHYSC